MRYTTPPGGDAGKLVQFESVRQLFNEALDPATLDGANLNLPSKGSTMHGTGRPPLAGLDRRVARRCSPCAWFWKARGCNSGHDCTYCHLCPEGAFCSPFTFVAHFAIRCVNQEPNLI